MRLSGVMCPVSCMVCSLLEPKGASHKTQRVLQLGCAQAIDLKALRDVVTAERAVGTDEVGLRAVLHGGHGLEHRFADFHGLLVVGLLHAEGAGVARTAF